MNEVACTMCKKVFDWDYTDPRPCPTCGCNRAMYKGLPVMLVRAEKEKTDG